MPATTTSSPEPLIDPPQRPASAQEKEAIPGLTILATAVSARQGNSSSTRSPLARDRVDKAGKITLRHHGQLYSIGIGRTHTGTHVLALVHDLDIRIIDAATGELLRELTLDPSKRYQGTGRPPGPRR